ncbi:hypothetical protein ACE6H2_016473 [Prunus campanulata]
MGLPMSPFTSPQIIGHQPSAFGAISLQPSAIGHQPSATSLRRHQPSAISHQPSVFFLFSLGQTLCAFLAPSVGSDTKHYVVLLHECSRHPFEPCPRHLLQSAFGTPYIIRPVRCLLIPPMIRHLPSAFGTPSSFGACDVFTSPQ